MDIYLKFRREAVGARQIDTLIGLAQGIAADGVVTTAEAQFLRHWLAQNRSVQDHPVIGNLLDRIDELLRDEHLDADEAHDLLAHLRKFGGASTTGEVSRPTSLPLNDPVPQIEFPDRLFLFTGTCAFGARRKCNAAVEERGGRIAKGINKEVEYLVIGSYVTDSWMHETFGTKITTAAEYRGRGLPIAIVTEGAWLAAAGLL